MSDVLLVGAGPTGLTLAAHLHAHGARPRIVERRPARATGGGRAFVVHARTLESLARIGLAAPLVAAGRPLHTAHLHVGGRTVRLRLTPAGIDDTAYPYLLAIPQRVVEAVLADHLDRVGVEIEYGTEVRQVVATAGHVSARLHRDGGGSEDVEVAWLVGCDGRDSLVRRAAGLDVPTRPYPTPLLLADLEVDGDLTPGIAHGFVAPTATAALFPAPTGTGWRLVAPLPRQASRQRQPSGVGLAAHLAGVTEGRIHLRRTRWLSLVQLRRGQAARYRTGRLLVAGDAAHVHSPAAAQGMNIGMQDAANLGWKLALVAAGTAAEALLDSYTAERWPVARRTRQLTDLAFALEASDRAPIRWLRRRLAPPALAVLRDRPLPAFAFRLLAGLVTRARASPLASGPRRPWHRGPHAGDRLPDGPVEVDGHPRRLHELVTGVEHHLLLCGTHPPRVRATADALAAASPVAMRVHHVVGRVSAAVAAIGAEGPSCLVADSRPLRRLGVPRHGGVWYLVRPDGDVAAWDRGGGFTRARHYLALLRPPAAQQSASFARAPAGSRQRRS